MLQNKKNLILISSIILLTFTYILSFVTINKSTSRKQIKTELINEKYQKEIVMFQLKQGNDLLTLSKVDDLWFIQKDTTFTESIPADSKRIQDFISELIKLRQIYKISDKINQNNDFGLNDDSTLTIRYYLEDSTFSDLIFGGKDFSKSYRYLMTGKSLAVFQIDSSLETFLSLNTQMWCDPNIISKSVLGPVTENDIQTVEVTATNGKTIKSPANDSEFYTKMNKLLNLRHGGLGSAESDFNPEYSFKIEFGNKEWATIQIALDPKDNDYNVRTEYFIETINKKYVFYSKISLWTYNSIKENTL